MSGIVGSPPGGKILPGKLTLLATGGDERADQQQAQEEDLAARGCSSPTPRHVSPSASSRRSRTPFSMSACTQRMSHGSLAAHRAIESDPTGPHSTRVSRRQFRAPADVRTVSAVSRTRKGPSSSSRRTARLDASAARLSLARRTRVERVESKI